MNNPIIDAGGTKRWYSGNGKLHRLDGPAIESTTGHKEWFLNGTLHRPDGPAMEYCSSTKKWYQNGQLHRLDGPAIEYVDGDIRWYKNGVYWPQGEAIYTTTEITLCLLPLQLPAYVIQWILEWVCPEVTILNQVKLINLIQSMRNFHQQRIFTKN